MTLITLNFQMKRAVELTHFAKSKRDFFDREIIKIRSANLVDIFFFASLFLAKRKVHRKFAKLMADDEKYGYSLLFKIYHQSKILYLPSSL